MAKRPKTPTGCYWRKDTLWGRIRKDGRDLRWSLETNDPKVAAERFKAGKAQYVAMRHGDAKLFIDSVIEDWAEHWLLRNKSGKTANRYLVSIGQIATFIEGKQLSEIDGALVAGPAVARWRKPAVEPGAIVPIGNRYDIGETGFVDILRPVPMRGAVFRFEPGRNPRERLQRGF